MARRAGDRSARRSRHDRQLVGDAAVAVAEAEPAAPAASPAGAGGGDAGGCPSRSRRQPFSAEQKQELGKIIKEYLLANPEVILEAQTALEAKMEKEQAEKLKVAIAENAARDLSRSEGDDRRQPQRRHHGRRVLRLQLRLLQARPARRRQAGRERSEGARRIQGAADPVEGFGGSLPASRSPPGGRASIGTSTRPCSRRRDRSTRPRRSRIADKLGLDMDKLKKDMASPEVEGRDREVRGAGQEDGRQRHAALPRRRPRHRRALPKTSPSCSRSTSPSCASRAAPTADRSDAKPRRHDRVFGARMRSLLRLSAGAGPRAAFRP